MINLSKNRLLTNFGIVIQLFICCHRYLGHEEWRTEFKTRLEMILWSHFEFTLQCDFCILHWPYNNLTYLIVLCCVLSHIQSCPETCNVINRLLKIQNELRKHSHGMWLLYQNNVLIHNFGGQVPSANIIFVKWPQHFDDILLSPCETSI